MTRRSLKELPPEEKPFPLRGYVIINLLFYLFLVLVYWAAYWFQHGEVSGMLPVLLGLAVLFTAVTVYDAAFDRHTYGRRMRAEEEARRAEQESRGENSGGGPADAGPRPAAREADR